MSEESNVLTEKSADIQKSPSAKFDPAIKPMGIGASSLFFGLPSAVLTVSIYYFMRLSWEYQHGEVKGTEWNQPGVDSYTG